MQELLRIVRDNSERASVEQRRHYNLRRREWRLAVGSLVLLRRHVLSKALEVSRLDLLPNTTGHTKWPDSCLLILFNYRYLLVDDARYVQTI